MEIESYQAIHNNLATISIFYLTCLSHDVTFEAGLDLLPATVVRETVISLYTTNYKKVG
jgi:hypothetical protein